MNTVLLMLGSNSDPEINLKLAIEKLAQYFDIVVQSTLLISKPVGNHYINDFHNLAIKLYSNFDLSETKARFKQIEMELGRTPESKKTGLICIDIDLIFWNGILVHKDYERFFFVKDCIDEVK